jgi:hypothetical protein
MWWAKSSPAMVEDLAEIIKVPSTFTMDALTYQVGSDGWATAAAAAAAAAAAVHVV